MAAQGLECQKAGGGGFKQESAGDLGYCQTKTAHCVAGKTFVSLQSPLLTDFTPFPPLSKTG